ncbi:sortase domain-bontaining protein [Streptomyces sp. NPDC048330]|uniref:sortase domain-containing protein n=1 Tax=Streptomyces sp. NPDC048330 TaxID=3365533 RepID=UPI003710D3B8
MLTAGYLDTATAPAVFARLGELDAGDTFELSHADGTSAVFRIDCVESFEKDEFPDKRVYDDTPSALVRLITCAGAYDRTAKHYTENLVVSPTCSPPTDTSRAAAGFRCRTGNRPTSPLCFPVISDM